MPSGLAYIAGVKTTALLMCYHYENDVGQYKRKDWQQQLKPAQSTLFESGYLNGFTHPMALVLQDENPHAFQAYRWGLVPPWATIASLKVNTLNAMIETLTEKAAYRQSVAHRCLIPATAFFEWQWQDAKGKVKKKFRICLEAAEAFCFAGIYENETFTIVTTAANALMAEIHNNKKRMPVVLTPEEELYWLQGGDVADFTNRNHLVLEATPLL